VRFAFTTQQREFQDAVRQALAKECTVADVRAAFDSPAARTRRWATLADMGVVGLSVPEDFGGLGLGLVDLVPLLEEAGRVALPEPLVECTALAAPLLAELGSGDSGSAAATAGWLSGIAAGEVTVAVADPAAGPLPASVPESVSVSESVSVPVSESVAVSEPVPVPVPLAGADGADLFVLVAPGEDGREIHVVGADRVRVTPVSSLDPTRRLGIPGWTPTPDTCAASGPEAAAGLIRTSDRAAVACAAQLLGLCERMIGMAADYAKERHQFGKPIGSFQAVKHLLAGAQVRLEFARPVVYAAAWSFDQGEPTASRAASTAKAYASDAAAEAARVSLQVHGAIGYTWECDLHLFLKRTWALSEAWGSAAYHRHSVLGQLTGHP
jgi:alkylation response protein AidB-like acyl-CoA dehydrogenase